MDVDHGFRFSPRPNRAHEIEWRPWGEAAFAEARRLGRPVLLSLSAVWCHWCHVMDETSYSDPGVIAAVNEHYVPVRVDNDRHPDVNRRYNMGGWPTTAFLTPAGDIITGATYLPVDQLRDALKRVREFFDAERTGLQHVERPALEEPGVTPHEHDDAALTRIPEELVAVIVRAFDPPYGGIGLEPKFPQPDVFAFLLAYAGLRPEAPDTPHVQEVLAKTLDAMARGALYDHRGAGFFRYSTRRDWSEPHYEKMLEDEARLVLLYVEALASARAGKDAHGGPELYRSAAEGAVEHLTEVLWLDDPPAFGGSQDADETYYRLGSDARETQPAPAVDRTVYVDWNALAVSALLRAAAILARPDLAERATSTLAYLWSAARRERFMAHFLAPGDAAVTASPLLTDQAAVSTALLDAYETSSDRRWLERAQELAEATRAFVSADGRFNDRLPLGGDSAGLLAQPVPSLDDNAAMVSVLARLSVHTGDERHRDLALDVLAAWLPFYQRYGVGAAPYGTALLRVVEHPTQVVVVGERGAVAARRLQAVALAAPRPLRTVQLLDPADPADERRIAAGGYAAASRPVAYVCRHRTCSPPVSDAAALTQLLAGD